jgi:hypothetical protein
MRLKWTGPEINYVLEMLDRHLVLVPPVQPWRGAEHVLGFGKGSTVTLTKEPNNGFVEYEVEPADFEDERDCYHFFDNAIKAVIGKLVCCGLSRRKAYRGLDEDWQS